MTAEIINQRHFWQDIGSSSFFLIFLMVGLNFFPIRDPWAKRIGPRPEK